MASHVPFLAVRPDEQYSPDIKASDSAVANGIPPSSNLINTSAMDPTAAPEAPLLPVMPASRLPAWIRFPLACLLSLSLSMLLYSLVADWAGFQLAAVSRDLTNEWQVGAFVAWKIAELSVAWFAGYDWQDLTSLACLSHLPYYFLLYFFYKIDLYAIATAFFIDISAVAVPFALLRPLIRAHESAVRKSPNQEVAQDWSIFGLVAGYGSVVYAVFIYASLYTWLPVYLVRNFTDVRTMEMAHTASIPVLTLIFIPLGWATAHFLYMPAIGSKGNPGLTDPKVKPAKVNFNPETATFSETLAFNLGFGEQGWSKRAEIIAKRTAVLAAGTFANNFVRIFWTVEGTTMSGAIGYAGMWAAASAITGLSYAWVCNE